MIDTFISVFFFTMKFVIIIIGDKNGIIQQDKRKIYKREKNRK